MTANRREFRQTQGQSPAWKRPSAIEVRTSGPGTNRTSDFAGTSISAKRFSITAGCSAGCSRANSFDQRTGGLTVSVIKMCSSLKACFALPQKRVPARSTQMEVHPMNCPAAYLRKKSAVSKGSRKYCFRFVLLVKYAKTISCLIHLTELNIKQRRELPQQSFVYVREVKKRLIGNNSGHHCFRGWVVLVRVGTSIALLFFGDNGVPKAVFLTQLRLLLRRQD